MKCSLLKQDISKRRFALPNDIWTQNLKPPAFTVLAYLQYRHCRRFGSIATTEELAERILMSVEMAKSSVETLIKAGLLTADFIPILPDMGNGKFFSIPDEVFYLKLGHGAIAVYAYLLYCEDRRTHQCHPSYNTISAAVGLAVNTVPDRSAAGGAAGAADQGRAGNLTAQNQNLQPERDPAGSYPECSGALP